MPILSWVNDSQARQEASKVPFHLLEKVGVYGDANSENLLVQGDNLLALKALLPFYRGKVKCIYIDPPYNTGSAFEYYDDNLEHSQWLSLLYPRLELLKDFLSNDGFFCCQIDDSEGAYLKTILDEIFGRSNYLTTIYVRVRYPDKTLKEDMAFHKEIEQIHIYRKTPLAKPFLQTLEVGFEKFCYRIETTGVPSKTLNLGGKKVEVYTKDSYKIFQEEGSEYGLKEVWASGTILNGNSSGRFFRDYLTGRSEQDGLGVLYKVYGIGDDRYEYRYFTGPKKTNATKGKYYQGVPIDKLGTGNMKRNLPIGGFFDFAASFGNCRHEGGAAFRGGKKPEILLKQLLQYFTRPGDYVLDSFLGSGTTAAVAHKMNRKFIGIELGEHAQTLCIPRLMKVIEGEQSGISKVTNWQGGEGFNFYKLGEPVFDEYGSINPDVDFKTLAAFIWQRETNSPTDCQYCPLLGEYQGKSIYLLFNGILGDMRPRAGNVLNRSVLKKLLKEYPSDNVKVVYGDACFGISDDELKAQKVIFKQIPYDLGV